MSRNQEFHNELGLHYGPPKPDFGTRRDQLVFRGLKSWDASPDSMAIHMENVRANAPAGSGSAEMHAAADAVLRELWDNPQQHDRTLYRGTRPSEAPGVKTYTENSNVAKRFAKKYGGSVRKVKKPVGLDMRKHLGLNQYDIDERQWIIDETDPRNRR